MSKKVQRIEVEGWVLSVKPDWRQRGAGAHFMRFYRISVRGVGGIIYYMKTRAAWAFNVTVGERVILSGRPIHRAWDENSKCSITLHRPLRKDRP